MTGLGRGNQKSVKDSSGGKSKKERKMRINILANTVYTIPDVHYFKQQERHLNVAPGNVVQWNFTVQVGSF